MPRDDWQLEEERGYIEHFHVPFPTGLPVHVKVPRQKSSDEQSESISGRDVAGVVSDSKGYG